MSRNRDAILRTNATSERVVFAEIRGISRLNALVVSSERSRVVNYRGSDTRSRARFTERKIDTPETSRDRDPFHSIRRANRLKLLAELGAEQRASRDFTLLISRG